MGLEVMNTKTGSRLMELLLPVLYTWITPSLTF
jgi:hypothetical protein